MTTQTEAEKVENWRLETLMMAGYDQESAEKIAARTDIDLHRAVDLLLSGCAQDVAASILL